MSNHDFSDRLLSAEQTTPAFRERYEKEIKAMLEKNLKPIQRISFGLSAAMGAAFAIGFGYVALITSRELPLLIRASFGLGSVFGAAWAIIGGKIAKTGKMNLRVHPNALNGMMWVFLVLLQTIYLVIGGRHPDRVVSVFMVVFGLTFLLGGAAGLIVNKIEQSELNMKEKLLGIELRLTEIAESLPKKETG